MIVAALSANDVAYVIVGGLALAAHGAVRATRDLDRRATSKARARPLSQGRYQRSTKPFIIASTAPRSGSVAAMP
jgi:hypothetical protein